MTFLEIQTDFAGQISVRPRRPKIRTDATLSQVTTAGFLNSPQAQGYTFYPDDMIDISYGDNVSQTFTISSISSGVITLEPSSTDIDLPVTTNHIAVFTDTSGTLGDDATRAINGGGINAGLSGTAGTFRSYPSVAAKGYLEVLSTASTDDYAVQITNVAMGQATTIQLPDPGGAQANVLLKKSTDSLVAGNVLQTRTSGTAGLVSDAGIAANKVLTSAITTPDVGSNLIWFDVTVGQAALAAGGSVTLYASSGAKQFKIRNLIINKGGTNFSGGGGDRLGQITDGTTVYSVIPATNLQTLVNSVWGASTPLPLPASVATNTSTVAGASLVFKYSGGTTDYTAGSIVVSGVLERVA